MKKAKALRKAMTGPVPVLEKQEKLKFPSRKGEKEMDFSKVGKKPKKEKTAKAKAPAPAWLKDCEICNVGLCKRMDELIADGKGLSQREAAKELEGEAQRTIGEKVWTAEVIRHRYIYHTAKSGRNPTTPLDGLILKYPSFPLSQEDRVKVTLEARNQKIPVEEYADLLGISEENINLLKSRAAARAQAAPVSAAPVSAAPVSVVYRTNKTIVKAVAYVRDPAAAPIEIKALPAPPDKNEQEMLWQEIYKNLMNAKLLIEKAELPVYGDAKNFVELITGSFVPFIPMLMQILKGE